MDCVSKVRDEKKTIICRFLLKDLTYLKLRKGKLIYGLIDISSKQEGKTESCPNMMSSDLRFFRDSRERPEGAATSSTLGAAEMHNS